MIIKSNIFLQPRTSHYMEHELACLLCHKAASKITLHAQFSLPFPICLNEPVQAVSRAEKRSCDDCQSVASRRGKTGGGKRGGTEKGFKEVGKGQAQITLAVTGAPGCKRRERMRTRRRNPTVDGRVSTRKSTYKRPGQCVFLIRWEKKGTNWY